MENKIIITGGSGMVGSAFKSITPQAEYPGRGQLWNEMSRAVTNNDEFFTDKNVIHLAAKVGGVKVNTDEIADFYMANSTLNQTLLNACSLAKTNKVVSLLSTCVYPDAPYVSYPLTEDQLHLGPPHSSNFGYAYAKRMVDVMSRAYRQQYGCNFITAIPNNLYGENDNFDLENSHVIPAIIRKIWEAKIDNSPSIECWGNGSPLREFTYSQDIAHILLFLMKKYDEPEPINIGNTEEYSIKEVVEIICNIIEYRGNVVWNTDKPSGQYRKPSSNKKLLDLGWKKEWYTSLQKGLKKTCEWFIMNYPNIRGIS
jgi:GDP-L-fucose synthase